MTFCDDHGNLPAARRILCRPTASSSVSGHKTNVAGVIQSNNAANTGVAPNITLVDGIGADFSDAEMMAATDCVVSQNATAINMTPIHDPVAAVTLCADVSNVEHVIVDGEFRKRDFKLLADVGRARTLVENARDYLVEAAAKAKATTE